ncbi:hypothetical protein VI817_008997 [Penicillium citrinum]|nr:hypothetical protein VI817_008997 [Penicillium citrinum]
MPYVEALEQQQVRLVHGLQELYRRSIGSGGWIGEHPKLETDGQPLIHNLLLSLGALDHPNDNTSQKALDGLQQEDECTHAEFQHLKSTERGSDSLQLPVASSRFARDTSSREGLPLTPPTYSLSTCTSMDNEPEVLDVSQFAHSTTVHGVINPEDHYCSQERPYLEFSPFDDIYSWSTPEAANIYFGDQPFTAPTSNWQHLKDGASQERYHDSKSYYEDFDNFSC